MNKHIGIITGIIIALFCSCRNQNDNCQDTLLPVSEYDVDSLFCGVEQVRYRAGRDTHNLVYCISFQNGRRCNILINPSNRDGFFFNIDERGINPNKRSLNKDNYYFKEEYGCDVERIIALVQFCRRNNFVFIAHYNDNICCHTNRSLLFFYSMDSFFLDEKKYNNLGHNWFTPKLKLHPGI